MSRTNRKQWLVGRQAAQDYVGGVSRETMRRWERLGLPSYKPHGTLLYCPEEIDEWVRSHPAQTGFKAQGGVK